MGHTRLVLICLVCWWIASAVAPGQAGGPKREAPRAGTPAPSPSPNAATAAPTTGPSGGASFVEDRAAAKLIEAGQGRYDADEPAKAVEIWQSVIERYPRSRLRFSANMLLGKHFLERERAYERARVQFEVAARDDNPDADQRAEALMWTGACYYQLRNYGKSFQIMRDLIDTYPGSPFVNDAYYYIGLGHFQLGHYSRAIAALESVGTVIGAHESSIQKLEAGKRLFVRIDDADLAIFDTQTAIPVECRTAGGDRETVDCYLVARNARVAMGSIATRLGKATPGNGRLEVKGDDKVTITYIDQHTADKTMNGKVIQVVDVVGTATVRITDGAYSQSLMGVVLGKEVNVQITDADRDLTDAADTIQATAIILRPKSDDEMEAETAKTSTRPAAADVAVPPRKVRPATAPATPTDASEADVKIDPLKEVSRRTIVLKEVRLARRVEKGIDDLPAPVAAEPVMTLDKRPVEIDTMKPGDDGKVYTPPALATATKPAETKPSTSQPTSAIATSRPRPTPKTAPAEDDNDKTIHSGVFRTAILLEKGDGSTPQTSPAAAAAGDDKLIAQPGDVVRIVYLDEHNQGPGVQEQTTQARCLEGNIGEVRVSHAVISDEELRIQTMLKTAGALTNIGNRYREFGLKANADDKYKQALTICEDVMAGASKLGGHVLEQTYVQLWRVYFEMERLDLAAAMCQRLQQQFPTSGFVDEALLQLATVARKQNDMNRAIRTYASVVAIRTSPLRGEAQFGIAECYDQQAKDADDAKGAAALKAKAFEEYRKVYDQFPDSGRVGDAVGRMADYYYEQKDYSRATEVFENVLSNYPDAKFLDVILFNYGRCLYRMDRKPQAAAKFEQLLTEFPDSTLADEVRKILDAMRKVK